MSTVLFRRPARRNGPEMPTGEISLQEPPEISEAQPSMMRAAMTVLPMALMTGGMALLFVGPSRGPTTWLIVALMGAGMGGMLLGQMAMGAGERKRRVAGDRRDYLRYLAQHRRRVRGYVAQQREATAWRHPHPDALWSIAMTSRRWERRPTHPDFLELRAGTGEQRLAVRIAPMQTKPIEDLEPLAAKSLRRFIHAYSTLHDQPVAVFLPGFSRIRLSGDAEIRRSLARALVVQLATMHAPEEVRLALCLDEPGTNEWEWAKWLPHVQNTTEQDAAGSGRLVSDSVEGVELLLGPAFAARPRYEHGSAPTPDEPYVVVLRDGGRIPATSRMTSTGYRHAVLIDLDESPVTDAKDVLSLEVTDDELIMVRQDRLGQQVRTVLARPDRIGVARARAVALVLSPYRLGAVTEAVRDPMRTDFGLPTLLGIADLDRLEVSTLWGGRTPAQRLRVPIGVDADGSPVELDLKEPAQGGMGPHGMLIGATGSGKSELLRTLVLALAATHSSQTLNLVLVDFKGGATFLGLDELPHTSAVITNLADEAALVSRMRDALHGELVRRQELLRQAGGFSSALEYERARGQGAGLDPLPTLLVVVDEFSELLAAHREFIELFVMIGRLGRSLGVHLLLASQRLDDGRIGQLESHLSYRIGLRTFSAMESRSVIGVPDAYQLPTAPGNGFLRTDVSTLIRFKAAYVSGAHHAGATRVRQEVVQRQVVAFGLKQIPLPAEPEADPDGPHGGQERAAQTNENRDEASPSVLSMIVSQLVDQGPPAHQVWLPPLSVAPTLDQLLPALAPDPQRGLSAVGWPGTGRLATPVGFIDKPFEQARDLMVVDLAGVGGHVGVAGGAQTGKSTLLRTLICGLALTHSPQEIQFYCLDFGGGTFASIAELPHVGSVAGRLDTERVTRTVAEVVGLIEARERRFAALGVDGMPTYRRLRADGTITDDPYGDVFLVVDGWFTLRQEFEAADTAIRQITARGLNFGVHLLLSTSRWSEVYHGMRDQIGTRLELRLGDPVDSVIDLRVAATVPMTPGRGLTLDKLHFLAGLPRIDGVADPDTANDGARALAALVAQFWDGSSAPAVRTLPAVLPADSLPGPDGDLRVALGLDEEQMAPVWHNFAETPHLTVLGDNESGKTNLLRHIARAVTTRFGPSEARILIVDFRRELFDSVPAAYRLGYSVSPDATRQTVADAVAGLHPRMPGADISPEQLRRRDWWTGPRLFVLVDDYDMMAGHDGPLLALVPYLAQGGDIGLHVVVTRGAANAMRTALDPLIRRLHDANSPEVALSCPPSEGPLLGGVKARHLPAGRALLCTRRGGRLIQTAWSAPDLPDPDGQRPPVRGASAGDAPA